jgi:hypothetical protein
MPVCSWSTLAHCSGFGICVVGCCLGLVMGNFHNPVRGSRVPVNNILSSLVTMTFVMLNVASHPASHSFPMDTRKLCVRPGMRWAFRASCASCGRFNVQSFVLDCSVAPLGRPTVMVSCVVRSELCGSCGRAVVCSGRLLLCRLLP